MGIRVLTVVGTRPQLIKALRLSPLLQDEFILNTGQHYDHEMNGVFGLKSHANLGVGSWSHAEQTAKIMMGVEYYCKKLQPKRVLVYGDTNSTLGAALAASKLRIPIAHVEAGLRSGSNMPEEINRKLTDHMSTYLFAPTTTAMRNLDAEGLQGTLTGDLMTLPHFQLPKTHHLLTLHRTPLKPVLEGIAGDTPFVFPSHPRNVLKDVPQNVQVIPPVNHDEMIELVAQAHIVWTDSGGLQKESAMLGTPCVTLREETEWPETVQSGWNTLVKPTPHHIRKAFATKIPQIPFDTKAHYGENAASKMAEIVNALCPR